MKWRSPFSVFKQLLGFGLVLISTKSLAVADNLLQQSSNVSNIVLLSIPVVFLVLLILLLINKLRFSKAQRVFEIQHQELANKKEVLDGFNVGMLHLNANAEVIYANQIGAYYLGSNQEQVLNTPLVRFFNDEQQEGIHRSLEAKVSCNIQLYLEGIKKHLKISFYPQSNVRDNVAYILSFENISDYQVRLDKSLTELKQHINLLDASQLGQFSVDLENESFAVNELLSQLLQSSPKQMSGDLKQVSKLIYHSDISKWNIAFEQVKNGENVDFQCRFIVSANPDGGNNSDSYIPCRVFGISSGENDKGAVSKLHFSVMEQIELEQQREKNQVNQRQLKAILSANYHPMYLLDRQNKLQDCNAAFEVMFNHKLSKIKGLSIEELDFIPDTVKKMHPSGEQLGSAMLTSSVAGPGKEVEVVLADDKLHFVKIKLQSFQNSAGKRAGMVGMLEDVTSVKQNQLQLEKERTRFSNMLDMAPLAIATIDADDHIIQANQVMTERLGLSEKELKKGSFYQLFNDPNNSGKAAKKLHQTGRLRAFHAHLKGKNGELHPSELHVDLFNKEQQEFLCWISDISGEQYHQDKFEGLLQHSSMPMAVIGDKGFNQLNPAACEFFAVEDEDDLFGCVF